MSVNAKDVEQIAHLARIAITDNDITDYADDMNRLLELIATLQSVDTSNVSPMAHPIPSTQRLRDDVVNEHYDPQQLQKLAAHTAAGLYIVPQVID